MAKKGWAAFPHDAKAFDYSGDKLAKAITTDRHVKDADLIVMQEVHRSVFGCSAACDLGKRLGFYTLYAPGHAKGKSDYGVAILSKAPITSAQIIELPYYDVHFNSGRRIALAATITWLMWRSSRATAAAGGARSPAPARPRSGR